MKMIGKQFFAGALGLLCLQTINSNALSVTVQEVGVSPYEIVNISVPYIPYTGGAYAGTVKLLVDGVARDGFCIDPFHFSSSSPLIYDVVPLENAPKAPGTMGAANAETISKLWAMAYSPTMSSTEAAGLQVAIWEVVGGSNFSVSGNDYGASSLLADVQSYSGPGADLIGLTGEGQDYVIQSVPETGATVVLLALGVFGLAIVRRATKVNSAA